MTGNGSLVDYIIRMFILHLYCIMLFSIKLYLVNWVIEKYHESRKEDTNSTLIFVLNWLFKNNISLRYKKAILGSHKQKEPTCIIS